MQGKVEDSFVVEGGNRVCGSVRISGAKNALLPIISACVAVGGECFLKDFPNYTDTNVMLDILQGMGCSYKFSGGGVYVDTTGLNTGIFPKELFSGIRASVFSLGAVLARTGRVETILPGGCSIGERPIDIHLDGLKKMGANAVWQGDKLTLTCKKLKGAKITLPYPSVGATENLIITATLAQGETIIFNSATEPEVKDLANFLNGCGANILGAGSRCVRISGGRKLKGIEYKVIPDRIETATYLLGALLLGGECEIKGCGIQNILAIINKTENSACKIYTFSDKIYIKAKGCPKAVGRVNVAPYPAFPTDAQAQLVAMLSVAEGVSAVKDEVFPSRFGYVSEMNKLGADVKVEGNVAFVRGVKGLHGGRVTAEDLRGGAGLVLAALKAEGSTVIHGVRHIDRGYERFEEKLSSLGLKIKRK